MTDTNELYIAQVKLSLGQFPGDDVVHHKLYKESSGMNPDRLAPLGLIIIFSPLETHRRPALLYRVIPKRLALGRPS